MTDDFLIKKNAIVYFIDQSLSAYNTVVYYSFDLFNSIATCIHIHKTMNNVIFFLRNGQYICGQLKSCSVYDSEIKY
jgi:hypothetical protein